MPTDIVRVFWPLDLCISLSDGPCSRHLIYGFARPAAACGVAASVVVVCAADATAADGLQARLAAASGLLCRQHGEHLSVLGEAWLAPGPGRMEGSGRAAGDGPQGAGAPRMRRRPRRQEQQQTQHHGGDKGGVDDGGEPPAVWVTAEGQRPLMRTYAPMRCPGASAPALVGRRLLAPELRLRWPGHEDSSLQVKGVRGCLQQG